MAIRFYVFMIVKMPLIKSGSSIMIFLKMTFVHKGEQGYEIGLGIVPVNIQQLIRESKI